MTSNVTSTAAMIVKVRTTVYSIEVRIASVLPGHVEDRRQRRLRTTRLVPEIVQRLLSVSRQPGRVTGVIEISGDTHIPGDAGPLHLQPLMREQE